MGLWDKVKGKANEMVNQATRPTAAPPPPPSHDESPSDDEEMEASSDESEGGDDWGGWDPNDWAAFWDKVYAIELAGNESDDALDADRECGRQPPREPNVGGLPAAARHGVVGTGHEQQREDGGARTERDQPQRHACQQRSQRA